MSVQQALKALAAAVTGGIGWATLVVNSPEADITASEWIVLATAAATVLAVFTVPNAAKPPPAT